VCVCGVGVVFGMVLCAYVCVGMECVCVFGGCVFWVSLCGVCACLE